MKYGVGSNSRVSMGQVLDASKVGEEYLKFLGRGLTVGGLNCGSREKTFRIPQGTTELSVVAPKLDPVAVKVEFDEGFQLTAEEVTEA